ncbi:alpha/beta fold hydrolase [Variovorax sp. HJSM1_2]|uniref:alpha/beta fold hydrolase n=1 Tax=Variovorax sp. HJSM1_2 TaxID=3366263 RepID=UPI003BED2EEE
MQTLVLLPGLMCDAHVWTPLYPWLPQHIKPWVADYGMAQNLQVMAHQVLAQAPPSFALAGHSMGGRVALEVVRMAPQRVTHLALLDTGYLARPGGDAGEREASKRYELLELARHQGVRAMAQTWVQGMVHPARLQDTALVNAVLDMFDLKTADIFACQIKALLDRPDASDVLRALRIPTLLQCGAQDSWASPAQHAEMHLLVPHAQMDVIAEAGHMAPMEQAQAVAASLLRCLQR